MNICRIVSYLNSRLRDDHTSPLDEVAQEHSLTPRSGFSIRQYIDSLSLPDHLESALKNSVLITENAVTAGYNSLEAFSNTFRHRVGINTKDSLNQFYKAQVALRQIVQKKATFTHHASSVHTPNTLRVNVRYPDGYTPHVTCIGLFPTPSPKGQPVVGNALINHTETTLTNIPTGEYYLLVCELRYNANPARALRDNFRQRIGHPLAFPVNAGSTITLDMRPPAPEDTPIDMDFSTKMVHSLLYSRHAR